MQYKIINGAVYYDSEMVLENIDIEINDNEKIAIVGRNGCGKTTLLKAIMGEKELEEGTGENEFRVIKVGNPEISYLRQIPFQNENLPMMDEVLSVFGRFFDMERQMEELVKKMENAADEAAIKAYTAINERYMAEGGLTYKKECETMVLKFGFSEEDKKRPLCEFSGGQRTKIAFIKMLLTKPDILLLDEPTNHLDIETIEWLEGYLKSYKKTIVIVSHDRLFLDRIVGKVYEIEWGETRCYKGNYSFFEKQKREKYIKQQKDYEMQQAEIARINRLIERFRYKATKAKMVQSKIKLLEHMKLVSSPDSYDTKTFKAAFQPKNQSSRQVLNVSNLEIGYTFPIATVSFNLEKGQKLGIIGGNGIGKSTLLKSLMGAVPVLGGEYTFGYNTEIAYFDQQLAQINGDETIFNIFSNEYPKLNDTEVRRALGAFQFTGEEVFRNASTLSGGEKVRLTLCKILHRKPNVLILDEPTNHMDIIGKETLESILQKFEGTVIFVSHDRYFVRKIADRLLVFGNNSVDYFDGNFDEYEEKRANIMEIAEPEKKETKKTGKGKYVSPLREAEKKKKKIAKIEQQIEEADEKIRQLAEMAELPEVVSNYEKLTEIQNETDELKKQQSLWEEEWERLMEEEEQGLL